MITNCREQFCRCIHRIKVQLGEVVELVMISEGRNGMGNHPMHLHGHSFHVIGMQKVTVLSGLFDTRGLGLIQSSPLCIGLWVIRFT